MKLTFKVRQTEGAPHKHHLGQSMYLPSRLMEPENRNFPRRISFQWVQLLGAAFGPSSGWRFHQFDLRSRPKLLKESLWRCFGPGLWWAYAFLITPSQCRWSQRNCGLGSREWQCLLGPCFGRCETVWRGGKPRRELEPNLVIFTICFLSCLQRYVALRTSFLPAGTTCKSLLPWRDWFGSNRFFDTSNIVTWGGECGKFRYGRLIDPVDFYFVGGKQPSPSPEIFVSSLLSWIFMVAQSMSFISGMWYWSQKCYSGS